MRIVWLTLFFLATAAVANPVKCVQECRYFAAIQRRSCRIAGGSVEQCKAQADAFEQQCLARCGQ